MADNHSNDEISNDEALENKHRRRFITGITAGFGAVGAGVAVVPFALSMKPSERAKNAGAPVQFDFSKLEEGRMAKVEWRGKPVVILRRSAAMMAGLDEIKGNLADPDSLASIQPSYAQNNQRAYSDRPDILVMEGVCTHLGCSPVEKLAIGPDPQMGDDSQGGFFCPCHGSKFDLAGRVYKNVPATTNMPIPPYQFEGNIITVGEDDGRT